MKISSFQIKIKNFLIIHTEINQGKLKKPVNFLFTIMKIKCNYSRSYAEQGLRKKNYRSKISLHNQKKMGEYLKPINMNKNLFYSQKKTRNLLKGSSNSRANMSKLYTLIEIAKNIMKNMKLKRKIQIKNYKSLKREK